MLQQQRREKESNLAIYRPACNSLDLQYWQDAFYSKHKGHSSVQLCMQSPRGPPQPKGFTAGPQTPGTTVPISHQPALFFSADQPSTPAHLDLV